jgi:ABC-2 type transport system permease protein
VIVSRRAILDRRRGLVWWSAGLVGLVAFTVVFFPTLHSNPEFEEVADQLPEAMRSLFSISEAIPLTSAPGYLQGRLFGTFLPLLLLVFAIGAGARAIGGSEDDGTLELLLMNPVSRRRVAGERFVAMVAMVAGLTVVSLVAVLTLSPLFGALEDVSISGVVAACVAAGLLALLHGTLAFAVGAVTGRRSTAIGVATTAAVAGYLVQGLAAVTPALEPFRFLTPWHWYLDRNMLATGPAWAAVLVPLAVLPFVFVPGLAVFERRDLR